MGQAKVKRARLAVWREGLSETDKVVVRVAEKLYKLLPPFGACYRGTMFLRYHLEICHGIVGEAIVGYTNDGTDDLFSSHAWFEKDGRMTDLAISRPLKPEVQRPGPLVIAGETINPGWAWSYHRVMSQQGKDTFKKLIEHPETRTEMIELERRHLQMTKTAQHCDLMRVYLDGADDGRDYLWLAERVETDTVTR